MEGNSFNQESLDTKQSLMMKMDILCNNFESFFFDKECSPVECPIKYQMYSGPKTFYYMNLKNTFFEVDPETNYQKIMDTGT